MGSVYPRRNSLVVGPEQHVLMGIGADLECPFLASGLDGDLSPTAVSPTPCNAPGLGELAPFAGPTGDYHRWRYHDRHDVEHAPTMRFGGAMVVGLGLGLRLGLRLGLGSGGG